MGKTTLTEQRKLRLDILKAFYRPRDGYTTKVFARLFGLSERMTRHDIREMQARERERQANETITR